MASESVGILIEADDQASAKLQNVADNVDRQVKRIKDVGGKAKASTEFVGTLSNSLGNTAIGGFAGQLAQLTERISAFSEVSKAGGVGAFAFKAGLVAAAGVVTYRVAESIASWWFEADRWKQAMADGAKEAARAAAAMDAARAKKFTNDREELGLIRNPAEREALTNDRAAQLDKQALELNDQIEKQKKAIAAESKTMASWATAAGVEQLEQSRKNLDSLQKIQQELRDEADALRETVGERAKRVEAMRSENAARDRSDDYLKGLREEVQLLRASKEERFAIEAKKNAVGVGAQAEAEQLLRERAALQEKAEAEKAAEVERQKAMDKRKADADRIAELGEKENQRLEQQRIELDRGKEAAHAYALEMQGLDKATAERIAREQAVIDQRKKGNAELGGVYAATQGRLLTQGTGGRDPLVKLQQTAERQAKAAEDAAKKLELIYQSEKRNTPQWKVATLP